MDRPTCGQAGNLGKIRLYNGKRVDFGMCNFCDDLTHENVTEICGRGLKVRVCPTCLRAIQSHASPPTHGDPA